MCLRQLSISILRHFCLFLSCVFGLFNTQWLLRYTGSGASPESSITIYIGELKLACFVCLCGYE